jgi:hypothetical protein
MGDDAEYYFETMMQDPEFRKQQKEIEEEHRKKQKKEENFRYLVKKHKAAVLFLSKPTTGPHNLTPNEICKQLGISKSVYCACIKSTDEEVSYPGDEMNS